MREVAPALTGTLTIKITASNADHNVFVITAPQCDV